MAVPTQVKIWTDAKRFALFGIIGVGVLAWSAFGESGPSRSPTVPEAVKLRAEDDRDPAKPHPRFQLPEGFVIEKVAGAPLVRYPLFGCFDDAGRLYVAEGTGQSVPGQELVNLKLGKITLLEDSDGDGRFDKSTTFADGLISPQGVLWHDGMVYVASHPAIWRLEDTDGDGRADRKVEFVSKFNFNGNGCDIHGPFLGPEGWLYWTDGRHGYKIERPDGAPLEGLAARIWRCRVDGSQLERYAGGGFDNPIELAWTSDGELLGTMDQGAGDCLLHYVEGGVYPEDHACVQEFARTGPMLGVAKRYSVELPAALCGTMRYRSRHLGEEFRNTLVTTHYMTHKLVRSRLIPTGSTFQAEDTDFLVSSDPHLRLTDVFEDADGSLLMIDMGAWYTYGFLGNVIPRPEMLGAIYRIRRLDAQPVADARGRNLGLHDLSPSELVHLLDDPRPAVSDRVIERLGKLEARAVPALNSVLCSSDTTLAARLNALWALSRIDVPEARTAVRLVFNGPAASNQIQPTDRSLSELMVATQVAGLHRDVAAIPALTKLLKIDHLPLRRKIAEAFGRMGAADAIPAMFAVLREPTDPFLQHSLIYALIQINDREKVVPGLNDRDLQVRRAALIALDQMAEGQLTREQVMPLLESQDKSLQKAALTVVSHRPDWAGALRGVLRHFFAMPDLAADDLQLLEDIVPSANNDDECLQLISNALADRATPVTTRLALLKGINQTRALQLPPAWFNGMRTALLDPDLTISWDALNVVKTRHWHDFDDQLVVLSRNSERPLELRVAALECLASSRKQIDDVDFKFLKGHLSEATPSLLRLAVARTLISGTLKPDQLAHIIGLCQQFDVMTLRMFLPIFVQQIDEKTGAGLVDALENSAAAEALTTTEFEALTKTLPVSLHPRLVRLREKIAARTRDEAAYLAQLMGDLQQLQGDADAGKEVFLAPRNNCFACHRAVGRGGTIGPDLTRIGQFRTRAELLESVVFPSFSVAPHYQVYTVVRRDGLTSAGLIVRETPDDIRVRQTNLTELHIPRANVEAIVPSAVSLMPMGLEKTLTRQQLADLIEFLVQQR